MSDAIETTSAQTPAEHEAAALLPDVRVRSDSVLRAESLVKRYGKRRVVDDVSLEVHPGEVVGLLGPNGAGKTTTFYMIVGLIKHSRGRIFLDGEEITHKAMYKRARMGIGYLSQEPSVFRKLTVEDNIMAILETMGFTFEPDYVVLTANSPARGLDLLEAHAPVAAVISDQRMPEMSGVEFLTEVCRRHPETTRIILTGFSGETDDGSSARAFSYSASAPAASPCWSSTWPSTACARPSVGMMRASCTISY